MSDRSRDMIHMVDIANKPNVAREAEAVGKIHLQPTTIEAIRHNQIEKGNVFAAAQVAGILAAKKTSEILPLCHPLPIVQTNLHFTFQQDVITARCSVSAQYKTGVEMEALVGVTIALLTIWDMVKYLEKDVTGQYPTTHISNVKVIKKWKAA
jgi:cyclic pyranopterin phosphate synthase